MKYMGSKRGMLQNGLGSLLRRESGNCSRIVDLFSGSGSVAWFAAEEFEKPVLAVDLQHYSKVLAGAVIERDCELNHVSLTGDWIDMIRKVRTSFPIWKKSAQLDDDGINTSTWSKRAQALCGSEPTAAGPIWRAYGGHYFSPTQALIFDTVLKCLPVSRIQKKICLAAAIIAASKCAASPGHTAQPFNANRSAGKFLREAWLRDPLTLMSDALEEICSKFAKTKGEARIGDANLVVEELNPYDLVFIDPPYSGVHYSRFYHVLETLARGRCGAVDGTGRYPPPKERPVSSFSRQTESEEAIESLFESLAEIGCTAIVTFPAGECSNGLSGVTVKNLAEEHFDVAEKIVKTRFSTLGGNNNHRNARQISPEMILLLRPNS